MKENYLFIYRNLYYKLNMRTEIGLDPIQDWVLTQKTQTINLQSADERTRSIQEEKR